MNKPYFCRNFFLRDWRHKRRKNTITLLLFYGELWNAVTALSQLKLFVYLYFL